MNLILKRDPVWLGSLPSPSASPTLLLIAGDGQQVAVPAPLLLAVSPLMRSILADLLPPAYSPCFLSLPCVTEEVLHVMVDILATGAAGGEHRDKIEDVRQVFEMLGVEVSLASCQFESIQVCQMLDRSIKVENSSEEPDFGLDEENIIKLEVIVKSKDKNNADVEVDNERSKRFCPPETVTHINSIHKQAKFPCNVCPQNFTQKQYLVSHIRAVHEQIKIHCKFCPNKFTQERNLVRHIRTVHDQIKIPCNLCPQKFTQNQDLVRHIRAVHDQVKISCNLCPQKFTQERNLIRHIKSVHDHIQIPCNQCSKKFSQKKSLVKHIKSVHGQALDRSIKLENSSEGAEEENIINIEVIVKSEDKDNADVEKSKGLRKNLCPKTATHIKSFHDQTKLQCNLVRRIKPIHKQVKFICNLCPYKSTQKGDLMRHMKAVHDQIKITCNQCSKKFAWKKHLVRHIKSVHDQIKIPCNHCSQKFARKNNLMKHIKSVHEKI